MAHMVTYYPKIKTVYSSTLEYSTVNYNLPYDGIES